MSKLIKSVEDKVENAKVLWKPASLLDGLVNQDENFVYRWVNKEDPRNLQKKIQEGWVYASTLDGDKTDHTRAEEMKGGSRMTGSVTEYRDVVLMKMPRELADARKEYYNEKTRNQMNTVASNLKKDLGGAEVTGVITTQRGNTRTTTFD